MEVVQDVARVVVVGIGATAIMDAWLTMVKRMGVQTLNFAFIGRWVGHLFRGRVAHPAIGKAEPIPGELAWGWTTHYLIGIAFAGLLAVVQGAAWMQSPSFLPAVAVGVCTVVFPLFVMQPAMGLGVAASKTPTPMKNCLRSITNHAVFGMGLYLSAVVVGWLSR